MTDKSSRKTSARKAPPKLKKPHEDFPLGIHRGTGYWCKKVSGKVWYFGKISDDPKGKTALELWLDQRDDILAGRDPHGAF